MMVPKIIKEEKAYDAALARINELMDAEPGTPEGDELELLVTLLELYEKRLTQLTRLMQLRQSNFEWNRLA